MATTTTTRKPAARQLREWTASSDASGPALKIDREKRIIYGVKVLGRYSRNAHGETRATGGTEYSVPCMRDALPLYEGCEVLAKEKNHQGADGVEQIVGVLHDARLEGDAIRADLHYLDSHPMSARILEDVERTLGALGLSHDACDDPRKARFDSASRRLVIEKLTAVRSVDLVRRPATNRNLWESEEPTVKTTLRQLLESLTLTPVRQAWRKRLVEDDAMTDSMDAPVETAADVDPDEALAAGFRAAVNAVLDSDMDLAAKKKKIGELLTAEEKLTGTEEPDAPPKDEPAAKPDEAKTESVKDAEIAKLKHGLAVRRLCEELQIKADPVLLESAEALPDLKAVRRLFEREKARGSGPRSGGPPAAAGGTGGTGGKGRKEDARPFAQRIKG